MGSVGCMLGAVVYMSNLLDPVSRGGQNVSRLQQPCLASAREQEAHNWGEPLNQHSSPCLSSHQSEGGE